MLIVWQSGIVIEFRYDFIFKINVTLIQTVKTENDIEIYVNEHIYIQSV